MTRRTPAVIAILVLSLTAPALPVDAAVGLEAGRTVTDAGQVTGTAGTEALTGHVSGTNRLHLGDVEFEMARESWGFAAKQRDDADNVIYFRRR